MSCQKPFSQIKIDDDEEKEIMCHAATLLLLKSTSKTCPVNARKKDIYYMDLFCSLNRVNLSIFNVCIWLNLNLFILWLYLRAHKSAYLCCSKIGE